MKKRLLSLALAFILIVSICPAEALALSAQELMRIAEFSAAAYADSGGDFHEETFLDSPDAYDDSTVETPPRDLDTLKESENIILSDEGEIVGIKNPEAGEFTLEELNSIHDEMGIPLLTGEEALEAKSGKDMETLLECYDLTEAEAERGISLHGSPEAFMDELSGFTISEENIELFDEMREGILTLIKSGYTNGQAFAAYASSGILGVTIEELAEIKAEEILARQETEEELEPSFVTIDDIYEEPEQDDEYLAMSIKMGVPYSVIESYMSGNKKSLDATEAQFDDVKQKIYPVERDTQKSASSSEAQAGTMSSGSIFYLPEEILGQPYTYASDGSLDVNLNSGSYMYSEVDLSIPGVNGLDLNIVRRFDSSSPDNRPESFVLEGYENLDAVEVGYEVYDILGRDEDGDWILNRSSLSGYTVNAWTHLEFLSYGLEYRNNRYYTTCDSIWYQLAVGLYTGLPIMEVLVYDRYGNADSFAFIPYLKGIEPYFSWVFANDVNYTKFNEKRYGIGDGWSLGFSSIEFTEKGFYKLYEKPKDLYKLTTADGRKFEVDSKTFEIKGHETLDMKLEKSGNGYPGASYTLVHKDGKKEYFDSNGYNIAIEDKYGNKITLAYTFRGDYVSSITITDTLGNIVIYSQDNSFVPAHGHNIKWTLTLNGELVKEYFSYDDYDIGYPRLLEKVIDAEGQATVYESSSIGLSFNSYVPSRSSNDGIRRVPRLIGVIYPNGLQKRFNVPTTSTRTIERLGFAGYQNYLFVDSQDLYSNNYERIDRKDYRYEDYSSVRPESYYSKFRTRVTESQLFQFVDTPNPYVDYVRDTTYTFESDSQRQLEVKQYNYDNLLDYRSFTTSQEYLDYRANNPVTSKLFQTTTYTYSSNECTKNFPATANTVYYTDTGAVGMRENYAYTYDDWGNILTLTQPNNQVITYTYDTDGDYYSLPLTISYKQNAGTTILVENTLTADHKGIAEQTVKSNGTVSGKSSFSYDINGNLISEKKYTDASNFIENQYVYGNGAQVTEAKTLGVRDANGALVTGSPGYGAGTLADKFEYNSRGYMVKEVDAKGNETLIGYDNLYRITSVTNPDGTSVSYSYDVPNNQVTFTNENGVSIRRDYNVFGRDTGVNDVEGGQMLSNAKYDTRDRLVEETVYSQGEDMFVSYFYDKRDRLIEKRTKNSRGVLTSQEKYSYAYTGSLLKVTTTVTGDANSPSMVTTKYADNMGNIAREGRMLDGREYTDTYTYDFAGNILTARTAYSANLGDAFTDRYTYDHAGNILTVTNAAGDVTQNSYDWLGRLTSSSDFKGNASLYSYDALGRMLGSHVPVSGSGSSISYAEKRYTYDQNGNTVLEETSNNSLSAGRSWAQTGYTYNSRNMLTAVTDYDNGREAGHTQYYYDGIGNVLRMYTGLSSPLEISGLDAVSGSAAGYSTTKYVYDRFSNLTTVTDPLGQSDAFSYDINGNILSLSDRNGNMVAYGYDNLGRTVSESVTGIDGAVDTVNYTYTLTGTVRSESGEGFTANYTYDGLGRMISVSETGGIVKSYGYGLADNRTSFVLKRNGSTVLNMTYGYDNQARLTSVLDAGTPRATYSYDANSNRTGTSYANGVTTTYEYNGANWLTSLENKRGTQTLSSYSYTYYADGNQQTKTDGTGITTSYVYDGLGRLKAEENGSGYSAAYEYDLFGNRESMNVRSGGKEYETRYAYDANNRLVTEEKTGEGSVSTQSHYYSPNGNLISSALEILTEPGSSPMELKLDLSSEYLKTYSYDSRNRLTSSTVRGIETTYEYRPDGLRKSKTTDGVTTEHIWDGQNIAADLSGGAISDVYVRGLGLILARDTGGSLTHGWYLYNGHGDVTGLAGALGSLQHNYEYDAFGNVLGDAPVSENPFRYCGEYYDTETGFIYLRARYYDSGIGRFITEDYYKGYVKDPQSSNYYSYCRNNPVMWVDPSGYIIQLVGDYETQKKLLSDLNELTSLCLKINSEGIVEIADCIEERFGHRKCMSRFITVYLGPIIPRPKANGTKLINELISSDFTITIEYDSSMTYNKALPNSQANASNGTGTGGTITYNPNLNPFGYLALNPETGQIYYAEKSNYLSLGHELIHAYGYITGTRATGNSDFTYLDEEGNSVTTSTPNEELLTVGLIPGRPITENDLLEEHGLPRKGTYKR